MRFVRYDDGATGILVDDTVIDVDAGIAAVGGDAAATLGRLLPGGGRGSWRDMIAHWDEAREPMAAVAATGAGATPLAAVTLAAPLPDLTVRIIALGANVAAHAARAFKAVTGQEHTEDSFHQQQRDGLPPWGFVILPRSVVGPEAEIRTEASVTRLDYEVEAAIVLRSGGRYLAARDLDVWGVTVWNDLSIRDGRLGVGPELHRGGFNWALEKNFETGNACGPCVVVDEIADIDNLRCSLRVNGAPRQDWNTADMIYSYAETVAFLSRYLDLGPGDILLSGTGSGTAIEEGVDGDRWLHPGDRVEAEVAGVGVLANTVVAWRN